MELTVGKLIILKDTKEYGWVVSRNEDKVKIRKVGIYSVDSKEYEVKEEEISVPRTHKIKDVEETLKVGDYVITNVDGSRTSNHWIYGKVGEIEEDSIFIWNNTDKGSDGEKRRIGFKYSWKGFFHCEKGKIIILASAIKIKMKCFKCGEDLEEDEVYIGADNERYCKDCCEDLFIKCEECDEEIWRDEACHAEDGDVILCEDCYDRLYTTCSVCDKELRKEEEYTRRIGGEYYCEDCFSERFSSCSQCGETVHNDDMFYDEHNDEYLCMECHGKQCKDIHDYGYKPDPVFAKLKWEDDLYLGIELEVLHDDYTEQATKFMEFLNELKIKDRFYLKHDGSLDGQGFEIVSHPETLQSIRKNIKLQKILEWLNKNDFDSEVTDKCGLHVHINKQILEDLDITKLRLFFKVNTKQLMKFSKRDGESSYAKFETRHIKEIIAGEMDNDRYQAINLNSSRDTVELRIFRGSLNYERVSGVLQFSDAIVRFVKNVGITSFIYGEGEYKGNSWKLFIDWCKGQYRYKNLIKYLEKEQLVEVA